MMQRRSRCAEMIPKPPKPPCWRDFVCQADSAALKELYFTNLNRLHKPGLPVIGGVGPDLPCGSEQRQSEFCALEEAAPARSVKHGKRPRAKLHRTRSEVLIQEADLPNGSLTINLSDTKPSEFGLSFERRHNCNSKRVQEENTKRCRKWLATVEASQPLDDIAFTLGPGVDIEIPEECWPNRTDPGPAHCRNSQPDLQTVTQQTVHLNCCRKYSKHSSQNKSMHEHPAIKTNCSVEIGDDLNTGTFESAVR